MELLRIIHDCTSYCNESPKNYVSAEDCIRKDLSGMQIFEPPIFGIADATDPLFEMLKRPDIIHPDVMIPTDWLKNARSVISFFLPFTQPVKESNTKSYYFPSDEWLHARIEGQLMVTELGEHLAALLISEGFPTVFPTTDKRFKMLAPYASNWSERHVAYVCGLGTFGLSKGLITEKGIAGRFGSVITTCPLTPTERPYSNPFEYCTMCGKCQTNCPAGAIDRTKGITHGKEHSTCNLFLNKLSLPPHGSNQRSRYGCGKCQVNVPCENGIPHGKSHYHD